jgi:hypothetical protein
MKERQPMNLAAVSMNPAVTTSRANLKRLSSSKARRATMKMKKVRKRRVRIIKLFIETSSLESKDNQRVITGKVTRSGLIGQRI